MDKIPRLKRYVDDGAGFLQEPNDSSVNLSARSMNALVPKASTVHIDEFTIVDPGEFVPFLDIQYTFDNEGTLQTDLYVTPTDSRSYLQFGSTHPNHVFSAIVYSHFTVPQTQENHQLKHPFGLSIR